tara:strand:- start:340 stop:828 length:489 start_codon:yes stop_codon:yes gene_type:complete
MSLSYSKIKSYLIDNFRIAKVIQYGAKTAKVASDFGDDSAALKDMTAIYADTGVSGKSVIVGYLNKNQIAKEGEKRIFSLKPDGSLSGYLHLKNDGTCCLMGEENTAVRFTPLDTAISSKDQLIVGELAKIATAISSVGGTYTPGPVTTDLSLAESKDVKIK